MTVVMRRAAATTRTASPARERMGPYGSMTPHAARPTDARRRAGRGVRGRGRVVFAGQRRAQRRRSPRGPGGGRSALLVARRAHRRLAGARVGVPPVVGAGEAALLQRGDPAAVAAREAARRPAAVGRALRVARLGGDRRRLPDGGRRAGGRVQPRSRQPREPRARAVAGVSLCGARLQRGRLAAGAARARRRRAALPDHRPEPVARRRPAHREQPRAGRLPRVLRRRAPPGLPQARRPTARSTRFTCRASPPSSRRCSPSGATAW